MSTMLCATVMTSLLHALDGAQCFVCIEIPGYRFAMINCSSHHHCWQLNLDPTLPAGFSLALSITDFNLEQQSTCAFDYLRIFCGGGNVWFFVCHQTRSVGRLKTYSCLLMSKSYRSTYQLVILLTLENAVECRPLVHIPRPWLKEIPDRFMHCQVCWFQCMRLIAGTSNSTASSTALTMDRYISNFTRMESATFVDLPLKCKLFVRKPQQTACCLYCGPSFISNHGYAYVPLRWTKLAVNLRQFLCASVTGFACLAETSPGVAACSMPAVNSSWGDFPANIIGELIHHKDFCLKQLQFSVQQFFYY